MRIGTPLLESLILAHNEHTDCRLEDNLFHDAASLTSFTMLDNEGKMDLEFYNTVLPWRQLCEVCVQSDVCSLPERNNDFKDGKNQTLIFRPHLYQIKLPPSVLFILHLYPCAQFCDLD